VKNKSIHDLCLAESQRINTKTIGIKMTMTLLTSLLAIPVCYLALASLLVCIPVRKQPVVDSLDFDVLNGKADNLQLSEQTYASRSGSEVIYRRQDEYDSGSITWFWSGRSVFAAPRSKIIHCN